MPTTFWRLSFGFAIATLMFSVYLLPMFPDRSYADTSGYGSPVIAFEMASDTDDMINIFGPDNDPQRATRIAQMDQGNRWDFGFMCFYALFLMCFSFAAYKESNDTTWLIPAFVGLFSGGFDAIENIMLLKLTANFDSPQLLSTLWVPVYAKFSSIALSSFAAALYIFKRSQLSWKVVSTVAMLASAISLFALASPKNFGWILTVSVTACWTPMLIYAGYKSFSSQDAT